VAGLDEVGRGCLAGPVVVAAVVLETGRAAAGIDDSKRLSPARRERLLRAILRDAVAWGIGAAGAEEVDSINVLNATRLAMGRAVDALPFRPDHLLIDALELPDVPIPQTPLIGGDGISVSIAAASIVAEVVRARVMGWYDRIYPGYGFAAHKGYGTEAHFRAVRQLGVTAIHRRSFRGVLDQVAVDFARADAPSGHVRA